MENLENFWELNRALGLGGLKILKDVLEQLLELELGHTDYRLIVVGPDIDSGTHVCSVHYGLLY
jgi:hypothetical protein